MGHLTAAQARDRDGSMTWCEARWTMPHENTRLPLRSALHLRPDCGVIRNPGDPFREDSVVPTVCRPVVQPTQGRHDASPPTRSLRIRYQATEWHASLI